jgi:hypothetical protein
MVSGVSYFLRFATVLSLSISLVMPGVMAMAGSAAAVHHDHSGHQSMSLAHTASNQMDVIHVHSAMDASQPETHVLHGSDCHTALCCHIDAKYDGVDTSKYDPQQSSAVDALQCWSSSLTLSAPDRPPRLS